MDISIIITFLSAIILIYLLANRYVKRYAPENVLLCTMVSFSLGIYLYAIYYNITYHIFIQYTLVFTMFIIPIIFVYLQYNNIILKRKILYSRAKYSLKLKDYKLAMEYTSKLIKEEGRKAEYYHMLGLCYNALDDFINAKDCFKLAIEFDKRDYESYYELGKILDDIERREKAVVMFNNALRIKPTFYKASESLGICYTRLGKFKEALKVYESALEYNSKSFEIYYNIAMLYMRMNNYEKAEKYFLKCSKQKGGFESGNYNIGNMSYMQGDYDKAIEHFDKVKNSSLYGAKAYYKLANIYAIRKEHVKALSMLEYSAMQDEYYLNKAVDEVVFENMRDQIVEFESAFKSADKKKYKNMVNYEEENV